MKCILLFLIFSGLIAAGKAKKCVTCKGLETDNCTGEEQECENEDDLCASQIEHHIVGDDLRTAVSKRCISASQKDLTCANLLTENSVEAKFYLHTECCEKVDCTPDGITMPEEDLTENGHQCQACFIQDSTECTEYSTLKCTGNQKQCFRYRGIGTRPGGSPQKYAAEGCITDRACEYDLADLPGSLMDANADYACI